MYLLLTAFDTFVLLSVILRGPKTPRSAVCTRNTVADATKGLEWRETVCPSSVELRPRMRNHLFDTTEWRAARIAISSFLREIITAKVRRASSMPMVLSKTKDRKHKRPHAIGSAVPKSSKCKYFRPSTAYSLWGRSCHSNDPMRGGCRNS
ncbi:uncharacterized protein BJX67DRAFT_352717 [Aspergillus lucknowensis]|uniref:Secreted protein n=1 Tax=Aspergillus lucknowensis TaxID=176173 RepID=A0ABR4LSU3_9EURO